jgi:modification methylase
VALKRIEKELPLDESALTTMQSRRDAPKVAFGALVEAGLLAPGARLFDKQRRWTATVRADGSIASGGESGSIHGVGKVLQGAPSCNGWTFWHIEQDGQLRPIDTLRQLYLLSIED